MSRLREGTPRLMAWAGPQVSLIEWFGVSCFCSHCVISSLMERAHNSIVLFPQNPSSRFAFILKKSFGSVLHLNGSTVFGFPPLCVFCAHLQCTNYPLLGHTETVFTLLGILEPTSSYTPDSALFHGCHGHESKRQTQPEGTPNTSRGYR